MQTFDKWKVKSLKFWRLSYSYRSKLIEFWCPAGAFREPAWSSLTYGNTPYIVTFSNQWCDNHCFNVVVINSESVVRITSGVFKRFQLACLEIWTPCFPTPRPRLSKDNINYTEDRMQRYRTIWIFITKALTKTLWRSCLKVGHVPRPHRLFGNPS